MKPGEEDLIKEAGRYTANDPALLKLVRSLRIARRAWAADDEGLTWRLVAYDAAFRELQEAVQKKLDAEGERQAQQFPRREA